MKNPNLLYGIGIIVVIGMLSVLVGHTLPTQVPTQSEQEQINVPEKADPPTEGTAVAITAQTKKENCGCCAQRRASSTSTA